MAAGEPSMKAPLNVEQSGDDKGEVPSAVATKTAAERHAYDADEHMLDPRAVAEKYETHVNWENPAASAGLTSAQVAERLAQYGPNQLTPPKEKPEWLKLLLQFTNPLMALLIVAGGLLFMAYGLDKSHDRNNLILAIALISVVSATCVMSWWQERSASNVLNSLKGMLPAKTTVYRDGKELKVDASDLVPGDVVRLYIGDRVPADVRIVQSADLKVECSSLTGESDLIPATIDRKSDTAAHAQCLVFMSSLCMNGEGRGIVIRTGDRTMIGGIASLAGGTGAQRSSLQNEVHHLVKFVSILALCMAIALFVIGVARRMDTLKAFVAGFILVLVANVPEGLPATVTSLLTLTAQRLRERNVLIKRTDIIENLGCASIIASDKTGTLTQNKMTVENVWCNCELHPAAKFLPMEVPIPLLSGGAPGTGIGRPSREPRLPRVSRHILEESSRALEAHSRMLGTYASAALPMSPTGQGSTAPAPAQVYSEAPRLMHVSASARHRVSQPGTLEVVVEGTRTRGSGGGMLSQYSMPVERGVAEVAHTRTLDAQAAVAASDAHVLNRMSLGRVSRGTTDNYRMEISPAPHKRTSLERFRSVDYRPDQRLGGVSESGNPFTMPDTRSQQVWQDLSALGRLSIIATVCNKARFAAAEPTAAGDAAAAAPPAGAVAVPVPGGAPRPILGDATDTGLLRWCDRMHLSKVDSVRSLYKTLFSIPFNSANKWSAAVTECPGSGAAQHIVMVKGAPEVVVNKCSAYLQGGQERPADADFKQAMGAAYERCGFMGERVLGFAYKVVAARTAESYEEEQNAATVPGGDLIQGLVFCGLVSLVDPPRPGVLEAVQKCRRAGVRVAMVTGDHQLTAEAIARKVGIVTLRTPREIAAEEGKQESEVPLDDERVGAVVVTGAQIRELKTDEDWNRVLDHMEVVFARTSPQQKLQIVEHLQRRGEVVAVTGDGVNDSPALKKAQIGVAMGLGGSDVAREAADIVLLDDEFPSIINAIEEGRVIFDNLKKTVAYTLAHIVPEVFPIFLNLALGMPLGLGGLLILSIDLITEQGPAISLAYEKAEDNVMERPPRDVETDRLVDWPLLFYAYVVVGIMETLACMLAFFSIFWWHDVPLRHLFKSVDRDHFLNEPEEAKPLDVDIGCEPGESLPAGVTCVDGHRRLDGHVQRDIYWEAQAAWYATLILCQFWHVWHVKKRQISLYRPLRLFDNPIMFIGTAVSIVVMLLIIYVPQLHSVFTTNNLSGVGWIPHLIFLLFIVPWSEATKWFARERPDHWVAQRLAW